MYIGCNDPITLRCLPVALFQRQYGLREDHVLRQQAMLRRFRRLQCMEIDVSAILKMDELRATSLSLQTTSLHLYQCNQISLRQFLSTTSWNFGQITTLKLDQYRILHRGAHSIPQQLYAEVFCQLLTRFPNVEFLDLGQMNIVTLSKLHCDPPCADVESAFIAYWNVRDSTLQMFAELMGRDQWRQNVLTKLRGFCCYGHGQFLTQFHDLLLSWKSTSLQSLHFQGQIAEQKNGFINLTELCIYDATYLKIHHIMNGVQKLERIHLQFFASHVPSSMTVKLEEQLVRICNDKSIHGISLRMDEHIPAVLNALKRIECANKGYMRISIYIKGECQEALEYFVSTKNQLKAGGRRKAPQWVLKFRCALTSGMWERAEHYGLNLNKEGRILRITSRNKHCTLNGFSTRWLYACVCNNN